MSEIMPEAIVPEVVRAPTAAPYAGSARVIGTQPAGGAAMVVQQSGRFGFDEGSLAGPMPASVMAASVPVQPGLVTPAMIGTSFSAQGSFPAQGTGFTAPGGSFP